MSEAEAEGGGGMTNKWRRRARKWRKEARAYKGYYIDTDLALKTERIQNALAGPASGAAAALNKAEEYRQHAEVIEGKVAVYKGEAEHWKLTFRDHVSLGDAAIEECDALLAWQRRVREAAPADCIPATAAGTAYMCIAADDYDALMQAVESEPGEPKAEPELRSAGVGSVTDRTILLRG
jgi:hypothetical protein